MATVQEFQLLATSFRPLKILILPHFKNMLDNTIIEIFEIDLLLLLRKLIKKATMLWTPFTMGHAKYNKVTYKHIYLQVHF